MTPTSNRSHKRGVAASKDVSRNNMKIVLIIVLLGLSVLLLVGVLLIQPFDTKIVEAHIGVSDNIGFNLDTDKLYFGTTMSGGQSNRYITLSSPKDAFVVITAQGALAPWLSSSQDSFILKAHAPTNVKFFVQPPLSAPHGNYTGTVIVQLYHPLAKYLLSP